MVLLLATCNQDVTVSGETYGRIVGNAFYSNGTDHSGIILTLDKTDGLRAITEQDGSRVIIGMCKSQSDGSYVFRNLEAGTYTIYASSNDSVEKAVATNVVVPESRVVTVDDLYLTATGNIKGRITIDSSSSGNSGFFVYIAGTSFMAATDDSGNYTISGVPAGTGYQLIASKGAYTISIGTCDVIAKESKTVATMNIFSDDISAGNNTLIWKGTFNSESEISQPKKNWAYYNKTDGCSYIYDGTNWTLLASKGDQGETGAAGENGESIVWLGSFPKVPANPKKLDAYYNTTNGCSYIYTGEKWDFLAHGGCMGANLHMFSEEWKYNENFHWHDAICDHKDQRGAFGEHSWNSGVVTVQPTCISTGVMTYTCEECGAIREETIAANVHGYVLMETVDATCTEDGHNTYRCIYCGETYNQTILAVGHDFGTDDTCDICGYTLPSAHVHSMVDETVDPTCTGMGYTVHNCTDCDYSYKDNFIEALGHSWGSGIVTIPKTCTSDGIMTYSCANCDETFTEIIPAGHSYKYTIITAPTCVSTGIRAAVCTECGDVIEQEVIPASHTWNEGVVISEADCTTAGLVRYTCVICGESEDVETPAHGHEFHDGKCINCGESFIDSIHDDSDFPEYGMYFRIDDIVSAYGPNVINTYGVLLDYNEDASIDRVAVYLTQDGTMWRRSLAFTGSGVTSAYYVPFLSYDSDIHYTGMNSSSINTFRLSKNTMGIYTYGDYTTIGVNLADKYGKLLLSLYNVGQAGAKTRVFDNLDEMIAWLSESDVICTHEFGDWIVSKEPTCTETGTKTRVCSKCNEIQQEMIPATGHSFSAEWDHDGNYHWHAATCEHSDFVADKAEHSFSVWKVVKQATTNESGLKTRTCSVCGYEESEEFLYQSVYSEDYKVGDRGPANGWIIYDCDADNASGNADGLISTEIGWRYLEAAPANIQIVYGIPSIDVGDSNYSDGFDHPCSFGEYRKTSSGSILYVNGTTTYNSSDCTRTGIGEGQRNTRLLVDAMGTTQAYGNYYLDYTAKYVNDSSNSWTRGNTSYYFARIVDDLEFIYNGWVFSDWFMPSKEEMDLIYVLLGDSLPATVNNEKVYWSSSECSGSPSKAWRLNYGTWNETSRYACGQVRPVRAF